MSLKRKFLIIEDKIADEYKRGSMVGMLENSIIPADILEEIGLFSTKKDAASVAMTSKSAYLKTNEFVKQEKIKICPHERLRYKN